MAAAVDTFQRFSRNLSSPARNAVAVTPSDTADLDFVTRAIMVGVAGDVNADPVDTAGDATVVYPALIPGVTYPLRLKRIRATSTTATSIVAIW